MNESMEAWNESDDTGMGKTLSLSVMFITGMIEWVMMLVGNQAILFIGFALIIMAMIASTAGTTIGVISGVSVLGIGCALNILPLWIIVIIILVSIALISLKVSKSAGGGGG